MSDPSRETKSASKWLWLVAVALIVAGGLFWFAKPLGVPEKDEAAAPVAQSTEWVEEPKGPAVPVVLPTTPLKNVPIEDRDESREGKKEAE
jgi:hypothetical protein